LYKWVKHGDYMLSVHVEELKITRPARKTTGRKHLETRQRQEHGAGASPGIPTYVKYPRAYAESALTREVEKVSTAQEGNRNMQLHTSAVKLAKYGDILGVDWIRTRLIAAAHSVGLGAMEASKTVNSGLNRALIRSV